MTQLYHQALAYSEYVLTSGSNVLSLAAGLETAEELAHASWLTRLNQTKRPVSSYTLIR